MNEELAKYVELSELLLETHKRDFHQRSAYSAVRVNLINGITKESRDYAQPCVVSAKKRGLQDRSLLHKLYSSHTSSLSSANVSFISVMSGENMQIICVTDKQPSILPQHNYISLQTVSTCKLGF